MSADQIQYFKFASKIVKNKVWAKLSSSARTLYPVLLSFSDSTFKPVYPGTKILLELTGFKHKSSIGKARKELVKEGLITISQGTGRTNTFYQFRFPSQNDNPRGIKETPPKADVNRPKYNQIQISISNYLDSTKNKKNNHLIKKFGHENYNLAKSECKLAGIKPSNENIKKILDQSKFQNLQSWKTLKKGLSQQISQIGLDLICQAYVKEKEGLIIFKDTLPLHLKTILKKLHVNVFFEPAIKITRREKIESRLIK